MIVSFKHKGLQQFYETGSKAGIQAVHAAKLARILAVLDELSDIAQLNGLWRCHQLQGDRYPQWSLTVSGNWRVTFELRDGDVYIVDYLDYH
ncbi:type II toxin-antitoxin system RelE/ParE family toxin [Conchiformibius steedae]|uniref:type II toxin-antitoxin system RelE/ParE family toxin n=1 Tax=Conchiformibius steedae TaxID=153493 RepID=UPI0026F169B4|nr:type II toxin-antitoxin system RelE/ParE family toxin [Conchiformibius steedae]